MSTPEKTVGDGITLDAACVTLGGQNILCDLNLVLTERRIAIVGRNGSGKSTLLRLIAGLIPATRGRVRVDGIDPYADRRSLLERLGILFQNPDHQILFPTVGEELAFGLTQLGQARAEAAEKVRAHLVRLGRADWEKRSVATLSQGQRHWLCLQAVLMMEPATLLLDEPLAGLDLPTQARLRRQFDALPQRLITITHDPVSAEGADRVIWIDDGKVRADGAARSVLPAFVQAMTTMGARDADTHLPY